MRSKLVLNVFIGHQIESTFHSPPHFKHLASTISKRLKARNRKTRQLDLNFEFGIMPPGTRLWEEVVDRIKKSDITIFDISENNPNVLLEVGLAYGQKKHVILLKSETSFRDYPLPADINSFVYLPYADNSSFSQAQFVDEIANSIDHFLSQSHTADFYFRQLWGLLPNSPAIIVPGRLPETYTGNRFEDYIYLRNNTDLDALIEVSNTINRLYPDMEVIIKNAKSVNELPKNWEVSNLIFIGGPDFNEVVNEFDDLLPIEYQYGGADKNEVWLKHKKSGKIFKPVIEQKRYPRATDFGFFLKRRLPDYPESKLVFLGGARTWGVYGASLLLGFSHKSGASYARAKAIVEKFGSDPSLFIPISVTGTKRSINRLHWDINSVEALED